MLIAGQILKAALFVFAMASPFLTHLILSTGRLGICAYPLILGQAALISWFVFVQVKPPYRAPAIAVFLAYGAALCCLHLTNRLVLTSGTPHAVIYSGLLVLFSGSLFPGCEPVVTYFARAIHGPLSPAVVRYTRNVTWAWCVFFAVQLAGSAILLAYAPVAQWSVFVNILNAPSLLLMFIGERLLRPFMVANPPTERFGDVIHMAGLVKGSLLKRESGLP